MAALALAACHGSGSRGGDGTVAAPAADRETGARPSVPNPTPDASQTAMQAATSPVISAAADLAEHYDQQVEARGTYGIVSTGRHKIMYTRPDGSPGATSKVVRLALEGGALDLWVRPADEMTALDGKRVIAVGKLIGPSTGGVPGAAARDARPSLIDIVSVTAE